jgi:hypothetical protein
MQVLGIGHMVLIKLIFAFLAIVFGLIVVYFGLSGHTTISLFGTVLTRQMVQAGCIVCVVAIVLLNWKLIVGAFNRGQ